MDKKRRDFLKAAGISTLAGIGASSALVGRLLDGPQVAHATSTIHGDASETTHEIVEQ